ncbi:MAG: PPC domain-containing protein [Anaerolineae bacterium]|nr:PPC domain-containing protein [Gloeobacterales cyanobacterium ES-bin-313]
MKKVLVALSLGLAVVSNPAQAATFNEVESNDTLGTAQSLGSLDTANAVNASRIGDSSADYYSFSLNAGDTVTFETATPGSVGDTVIAFYGLGQNLLALNDDGPVFPASALSFTVASAGTYYLGVGDFGDINYDGNGTITSLTGDVFAGGGDSYSYTLNIGIVPQTVPEPTSMTGMLLLGLGGIATRYKKRRNH